ncbi:MAG: hypothetical protein ACM3QS_13810 [Bacteroidota bacterium]
MFKRSFAPALVMFAFFAACSVLEPPAGTAVPREETEALVSLPASSATPTIVWFPASPTPSLQVYATHTATPEMRPGVGQTTLHDSFTDEELWDTAASDKGSAGIDRSRLTLAVQPEVYLFSLRHGLNLDDFYAEITARPNLCRGADDYGVLIRASRVAYFRFSLTCNGMVQADRISAGTRQSLQAPIPSGDAPRGSPGEVRIGVWAVGPEMRLFLNGRYQFTVKNPAPRAGTIGVFVRSAGDTPVTVNFLDLVIQDVSQSAAAATPLP